MLGITLGEFLRFLVQFGFAVAGATSLWGFVLLMKARTHPEEKDSFHKIAKLVGKLFFIGISVFLTGWWTVNVFILTPTAAAHEGIKLAPTLETIKNGFAINQYFVLMIMATLLVYLILKASKSWVFEKHAAILFGLNFILLSVIAVFSVFTGKFDGHQLFFFLHHWHSIFTLGTVITVDFLYTTVRDINLKRTLYSFFPIMSVVIWIGLGLDFLSISLIYEQAISLTQQFYFIQTVVAIIIINGSLLSGKINDLLTNSVKPGGQTLAPRTLRLMGISGSVSIVSWLTITFVDFFKLTLNYPQLALIYVTAIVTAYFVHDVIEKMIEKSATAREVRVS